MSHTFTHYLRLEGVNLDSFVGDTRQLSVNRGGSLKLLAAVQTVQATLGKEAQIISQGASIGLWGIVGGDTEALIKSAREALKRDGFEHGTFVLNVVLAGDRQFRAVTETALCANRWQQMQAGALSIPEKNETKTTPAVCAVDWLRPADPACKGLGKSAHSPSVHSRWDFGRQQRQEFYASMTPIRNLPEFANEFSEIANTTGVLSGKMALFYADGNQFGSLQTKFCDTPAKQALWDHFIRSQRQSFLKRFLEEEVLVHQKDWMNRDGKIRFETLLWGGDELMFVMPAKLGWRFATRFFHHFGGLNLKDASLPEDSPFLEKGKAPPTFESQTLTHAAALIFSQHHAPIDRLKRLAKAEMAETAKKASHGRERDQLVYAVLESSDHLGANYQQALKKRYGKDLDLSHLILGASASDLPLHERLSRLSATISCLSDPAQNFARSQLRELVTLLIRPQTAVPPPKDFEAAIQDYFFRTKLEGKKKLEELADDFPHY